MMLDYFPGRTGIRQIWIKYLLDFAGGFLKGARLQSGCALLELLPRKHSLERLQQRLEVRLVDVRGVALRLCPHQLRTA